MSNKQLLYQLYFLIYINDLPLISGMLKQDGRSLQIVNNPEHKF